MVSSTTRKIFSFAISLLVAVISLTTAAQAASAPTTVESINRYTPDFAGNPGKMVRDAVGNFYVADFWGKRIVKLNNRGGGAKYIPVVGRPSAVYPLPDGRLVVAMSAPRPYVAFYSQDGQELAGFAPVTPDYFRPVAITRDKSGNIYVLDSGDISETDAVNNVPKVRVYDAAGVYKYAFGAKSLSYQQLTTGGTFKQPMGIAYEKASDRIIVVDTLQGRIQAFQPYDISATCAYDSAKSFGGAAGRTAAPLNAAAKFYNPVDIAFEYNGAVLNRMFVLERGHNEVAVVDAVTNYGYYRKAINLTTYPAIGKDLVQPASLSFENKIAAGAAVPGGVLYVNNAASSTPADIFFMSVDGGTVTSPGVTLNITSTVPQVTTATSLLISGTVSVADNAVFCTVNGSNQTVTTTGTDWSTTAALVTGYNHIVCKSTLSDLTAYAEADIYSTGTPLTAPTVNITSPGAGLYTKNSTVTVSGSSDTANATVRLTNALNGFTADATTAADKSWSAVVTLANGSNAITPTIWKSGTNVGSGAAVTVVADFVAPTVTVAFLSNGKVTGSAVQNLDGIVNKSVVTSIEVNGIDVPATAMLGTADSKTYFSMPVTLNRGSNTVTVKVTDKVGRVVTDTRTVTLDPDLPAFTVALPADNSYMNVALPSNGTSDYYTSVNAAGQNATPAGGLWSASAFTLLAGFNAYEFTASGVGKSATEKRTVINGTTGNSAAYVQLAITSPAADFATKNDPVVIQGFVAPGSPTPTITVDNGVTLNVTTYNPVDGSFSHSASLGSVEGNHVVKVSANAATSAVRNIIYDTVPPEFSIQANTKPAPTTISGALEPSAKIAAISASLSGSNVVIPLSAISYDAYDAVTDSVVWHANLSSYTYDTISFTAVDPAGNTSLLAYDAVVPTGDVDGDGTVRLADALAALRHVAGTQPLVANPFIQADVGALVESRAGRDGKVDITDATLILKKSYGLLSF